MDSLFKSVGALLEEAIKNRYFPGAALCIGKRNDILYQTCKGRLSYDDTAPTVTDSTLFDMASVTKIMCTSMLCFQAMEEGKLWLEDTLGRFFPDAPDDKAQITVEQLMTHTSGVIWHFFLSEECADRADVTNTILHYPLSTKPGTQTEYSCMGFMLLRAILEKIYGETLNILFQRKVAEPLGLKDTGFCPNISKYEIAPTEQQEDGSFLQGIVHDENARFLGGVSANAGLFSTLGDVRDFVKMLACAGRSGDCRFLSPATLKAAVLNRTEGKIHNRGLGFKLYGGQDNFMGDFMKPGAFGHTGFSGVSFAVEEFGGLWIVLLSNHIHPLRGNEEALRFRRLIYNHITALYHSVQADSFFD